MACNNSQSMGLGVGLDNPNTIFKRKFQWLFKIAGVSVDDTATVKALPPRRSARPTLSWKEFEVQHLTEQITYPGKPIWEPIDLILFDVCRGNKCNPVFVWIARSLSGGNGIYDPKTGTWTPVFEANLKRQGTILIFDGCGNVTEQWTLENCYPHQVRWGELDMDQSDVMTCECSIRFDRAYCDLPSTDIPRRPGDKPRRPGDKPQLPPGPRFPFLNPLQNPNVPTFLNPLQNPNVPVRTRG